MHIRELLKISGRKPHLVDHTLAVEDALALMAETEATALFVTDEGNPVGIFTRGDIFRCYLRNSGRPFREVEIGAAMTNKLITAAAQDEIEPLISMMIQADIDHLPIMEEGKITGLLLLRDLVRYQLRSLADEINDLQEYLDNLHDAAKD